MQDETTYLKLLNNPIIKYKKELEKMVHLGTKMDILNKKEAKYLNPESCRIPVIYTIPKIHKDKENPQGRPIVNGIDSLTTDKSLSQRYNACASIIRHYTSIRGKNSTGNCQCIFLIHYS